MKNCVLIILFLVSFEFKSISQDFSNDSTEHIRRSYINCFGRLNFNNYGSRERNNLSIGDPGTGDTFTVEISSFFNYEIIRHYFVFGAGLVGSRTYRPNVNMIAFTGELKGYLSNEITTIYIYLNVGKSFPVDDFIINGQHVSIGLGYRFNIGKEVFMIDFSSSVKSVQFDNKRFNESQDKAWIRGLYLGVGYQF